MIDESSTSAVTSTGSFVFNESFTITFCDILNLNFLYILPFTTPQSSDQHHLHQQLQSLQQQPTRSQFCSQILEYLQREIFSYYAMEILDMRQICQSILNSCEENLAHLSQFDDLLLLIRVMMFLILIVNQYFFTENIHRWYVYTQWRDLFDLLCSSSIGRVIIADEFDPLVLPRLLGHSHLTRVPLLRQISQLNYLFLEYWNILNPIQLENDKICSMYTTLNTWIYRCIYHPRPPPNYKPKKMKKKVAPEVDNFVSVKVYSVCCSANDLLFAGLEDGRICVWSAGGRQPPLGFLKSAHSSACVNALTVIHVALIAGFESGDIVVWKLNPFDNLSFEVWDHIDFHTAGIRAFTVCYSPKYSVNDAFSDFRPCVLLLSASIDQNICLWNASGCLSSSTTPLVPFQSIKESMSVNAIAAEWTFQGHGDGKAAQPPGHYDRQKTSHWLRVFTASGSGSWDRIIRVFTSDEDGLNLRQTGSLRGHEQPIDSLVILKPYGHVEKYQEGLCRLLSTSSDGTVRLWNTHSNCQILCIPLNPSIFYCLQYGNLLFGYSLESNDLVILRYQEREDIIEVLPPLENPTQSAITCLMQFRGILYIGAISGVVKEIYL